MKIKLQIDPWVELPITIIIITNAKEPPQTQATTGARPGDDPLSRILVKRESGHANASPPGGVGEPLTLVWPLDKHGVPTGPNWHEPAERRRGWYLGGMVAAAVQQMASEEITPAPRGALGTVDSKQVRTRGLWIGYDMEAARQQVLASLGLPPSAPWGALDRLALHRLIQLAATRPALTDWELPFEAYKQAAAATRSEEGDITSHAE